MNTDEVVGTMKRKKGWEAEEMEGGLYDQKRGKLIPRSGVEILRKCCPRGFVIDSQGVAEQGGV